jgi:hypothetical protein
LQFRDARNKKDQIYWETKFQRNEIAQGTPGTYRQNQLQHLTTRTQWLQGNQNFTLSPTKKLVDRFISVEEPLWCRYISVWRSWCRSWKIWCLVHRTVQGISCHSWHICVFWHGAVTWLPPNTRSSKRLQLQGIWCESFVPKQQPNKNKMSHFKSLQTSHSTPQYLENCTALSLSKITAAEQKHYFHRKIRHPSSLGQELNIETSISHKQSFWNWTLKRSALDETWNIKHHDVYHIKHHKLYLNYSDILEESMRMCSQQGSKSRRLPWESSGRWKPFSRSSLYTKESDIDVKLE